MAGLLDKIKARGTRFIKRLSGGSSIKRKGKKPIAIGGGLRKKQMDAAIKAAGG
jgi:hypothetical protein